jgi:hypothetical protein
LNVSAVYQNLASPPILANYNVPNAAAAAGLGRNLAACGGAAGACSAVFTGYPLFTTAFATGTNVVPLYEPFTNGFEKRLQQFDVRVGRSFTFRTATLRASFDLYNLFNGNAILSRNNVYGPTWGLPLDVLGPRMAKFGFELNF